jgi:dTDP-4-dehydrorhamnose reductase
MKVFITGAKGQLGTELQRQLLAGQSVLGAIPTELRNAEVLAVDVDTLDICDARATKTCIEQFSPDVVIHCAAMTNVDGCEDCAEQAERVNGEATKYLAQACEAVAAKLITISTDYVFSGDKGSEYFETDFCDPQSVYGRTKYKGEQYAQKYCSRTFIVRTAWLYGFHGHNFVKTILNKGVELGQLHVVNDQYGSPTNAEDLAHHILKLAVTSQYGIYHCTGNGACSWYDFACEIIAYSKTNCIVLPCTSQEYPQKAKRPAYSVLSHRALAKAVGDEMRPWCDALHDYIDKLDELI